MSIYDGEISAIHSWIEKLKEKRNVDDSKKEAKKIDYKDRKKERNKLKKIEREVQYLESEMEKIEQEKQELQVKMDMERDHVNLMSLQSEFDSYSEKELELMRAWEEKSEEFSFLEAKLSD